MKDTALSSAKVLPLRTSITITVPQGCEIYANDIRRFVHAMLYKLSINSAKGRWKDIDVNSYMDKMEEERDELREALATDNTVSILLEAADVANFALIIASKELDGEK